MLVVVSKMSDALFYGRRTLPKRTSRSVTVLEAVERAHEVANPSKGASQKFALILKT